MNAVVAGIAGIALGALLTSLLQHRAWLREGRLNEYAALLTAFRTATAESAKAAQAGLLYTDVEANPVQRAALRDHVVRAWDAGDEFAAAFDRVKLVASSNALAKANSLGAFVMSLRLIKPLNRDADGLEIKAEDFEGISSDAHDQASAFTDAAVSDVLHLRLRLGR